MSNVVVIVIVFCLRFFCDVKLEICPLFSSPSTRKIPLMNKYKTQSATKKRRSHTIMSKKNDEDRYDRRLAPLMHR